MEHRTLLFQRAFRRWMERFGLKDWKIHFFPEPNHEDFASVSADYENRVLTVKHCSTSQYDIDRVALHEVLHVVVVPLYYKALKRFATESEIAEAEHGVVRRIEAVMWEMANERNMDAKLAQEKVWMEPTPELNRWWGVPCGENSPPKNRGGGVVGKGDTRVVVV